MDERLRQTVRERAGYRCEYCRLPQDTEPFFAYHVERIVARQHGGRDDSGNLALACYHCNAHKGPSLSGLDPESGALVRLFHPRQDQWDEHFERNGVLIVGRTDGEDYSGIQIQLCCTSLAEPKTKRKEKRCQTHHPERISTTDLIPPTSS
jgi:hypothetical protein